MHDKLWWCVQVRDIAPLPPKKTKKQPHHNTTKQTKPHHNWQKYRPGKSRGGQRVVFLFVIPSTAVFTETVNRFWGDKLHTRPFSLPLAPVQPHTISEGCPSMCLGLCAQTMVGLPMLVVCNVHSGCVAVTAICSDSWLREENFLLCWEVQPTSAAQQTQPPTSWWAISPCHS